MPQPYSALIDANSHALLCLSSQVAIIVLLKEATQNTRQVMRVNFPNYLESFPLKDVNSDAYPNWSWDLQSRLFTATKKELLTQELYSRSDLAVQKRNLLNQMLMHLNVIRCSLERGVIFQESVYLTKKFEAQRFRDSGYSEEHLADYPFLVSYADFADLPLKTAADEIIFKAKLGDDMLAKAELIRLKYFKRVKEATDTAQLPEILNDLVKECYSVAIK